MQKPVPIQTKFRLELSPGDIRGLGNRAVSIRIFLHTYAVSPAVIRRRPQDRFEFIGRRADRWIRGLERIAKARKFVPHAFPGCILPVEIVAKVPADRLPALARSPGVWVITVDIRHPRHRQLWSPEPAPWYCVRERFVIEVESQRRGFQTTEERFVLVRALSASEARRLARAEARRYGTRYLNSENKWVRWRLEAITGVNFVIDSELRPNGSEVFSELDRRRFVKLRSQ